MLALFQTLFGIIRLRNGPDAIPYSWALCLIALTLWLFAGLAMTLMIEGMDDQDFLVGTFTGVAGLACYAAIVVSSGYTPRLLQTVTAILGCGALLSILFIAGRVFLTPLFGENMTNMAVTLILLWSIPVEGHILSRAINRQWYIGIIVAMAVFIFQLYLYSLLNPRAVT